MQLIISSDTIHIPLSYIASQKCNLWFSPCFQIIDDSYVYDQVSISMKNSYQDAALSYCLQRVIKGASDSVRSQFILERSTIRDLINLFCNALHSLCVLSSVFTYF